MDPTAQAFFQSPEQLQSPEQPFFPSAPLCPRGDKCLFPFGVQRKMAPGGYRSEWQVLTCVVLSAPREERLSWPEPGKQPRADSTAPGLPDGEAGDGARSAALQCPLQHHGARWLPHPHSHEVFPEGVSLTTT